MDNKLGMCFMRKSFKSIILILLIMPMAFFGFIFATKNAKDIYASGDYTVNYFVNGSLYDTKNVVQGDKAIKITAPSSIDVVTDFPYSFTGWFDATLTNKFDFNSKINSNVDLYAVYTFNTPSLPVLDDKTDTSFSLIEVPGIEYSIDGATTWQDSGEFLGLRNGRLYKVLSRVKGVGGIRTSEYSLALDVITNRGSIPAPDIPTLISYGTNYVEVEIVSGQQYSINGGESWQESGLFAGLTKNTEYQIITRQKRDPFYGTPGDNSAPLFVTTYAKEAPLPPSLKEVFETEIDVVAESGIEYSIDGVNWNTSGIFAGLIQNKEYNVYARYIVEDGVGMPSEPLKVKTLQKTIDYPTNLQTSHSEINGTYGSENVWVNVTCTPYSSDYKLEFVWYESTIEGVIIGDAVTGVQTLGYANLTRAKVGTHYYRCKILITHIPTDSKGEMYTGIVGPVTVIQRQLFVNPGGEISKTYDGQDTVTTDVSLQGIINNDDVFVVGYYEDKNVGENKKCFFELYGEDAGNYYVTADIYGKIVAKGINLDTTSIAKKVYDKTLTLDDITGVKLNQDDICYHYNLDTILLEQDDVRLLSVAFVDYNAGVNKEITFTLTGEDANNYLPINAMLGVIEKRVVTIIEGATVTKVYDGTLDLFVGFKDILTNILDGDDVIVAGRYENKNVGENLNIVIGLSGADSANYEFDGSIKGSITQRELILDSALVIKKEFDGNNKVVQNVKFANLVAGDDLKATAIYKDYDNRTGNYQLEFMLSGADAPNYFVTTCYGDVVKKLLKLPEGLIFIKEYDGTVKIVQEFTFVGLVEGDSVTSNITYKTKDAGKNIPIIFSITEIDSEKYSVDEINAKGEIYAKKISVIRPDGTQNFDKVYDGTDEIVGDIILDGIVDVDLDLGIKATGKYEKFTVGEDVKLTFKLNKSAKNYLVYDAFGDITPLQVEVLWETLDVRYTGEHVLPKADLKLLDSTIYGFSFLELVVYSDTQNVRIGQNYTAKVKLYEDINDNYKNFVLKETETSYNIINNRIISNEGIDNVGYIEGEISNDYILVIRYIDKSLTTYQLKSGESTLCVYEIFVMKDGKKAELPCTVDLTIHTQIYSKATAFTIHQNDGENIFSFKKGDYSRKSGTITIKGLNTLEEFSFIAPKDNTLYWLWITIIALLFIGLVLLLVWYMNEFTVTFDTSGGTKVPPRKYRFRNRVRFDDVASKDGYVFEGWYLDEEFKERADLERMPFKSLTLHARWGKVYKYDQVPRKRKHHRKSDI